MRTDPERVIELFSCNCKLLLLNVYFDSATSFIIKLKWTDILNEPCQFNLLIIISTKRRLASSPAGDVDSSHDVGPAKCPESN